MEYNENHKRLHFSSLPSKSISILSPGSCVDITGDTLFLCNRIFQYVKSFINPSVLIQMHANDFCLVL